MNRVFPMILVENATKAMEAYQTAFHARLIGDITYFEDMDSTTKYPGKIAHATMAIEQSQFFIGDLGEEESQPSGRITVNIELPTITAVRQAFEVLKHHAKYINYEPTPVSWSDLCFALIDEFEVPFMVYYRE